MLLGLDEGYKHGKRLYSHKALTVMPRRVAPIGLLVLATFSLAPAWGRKPPKEEEAKVTLRRISPTEVMDILRKFPEMVPSYLASQRNDTAFLADVFPFSEMTAAPLRRAFPAARFYKGEGIRLPPYPYLMAIAGDKRYMMTGEFNRLLSDNGMKVTDKNVVALAKAFILLAIGSERMSFPQIVFLNAKRIDEEISRITWHAKLKVKIGEQIEEWYFARWHNGLGIASRGTEGGQLIKQYDLPEAERPPKR